MTCVCQLLFVVKKLDVRVSFPGCASYGAAIYKAISLFMPLENYHLKEIKERDNFYFLSGLYCIWKFTITPHKQIDTSAFRISLHLDKRNLILTSYVSYLFRHKQSFTLILEEPRLSGRIYRYAETICGRYP